jgi:hypothetical protein
MDHLCLPVKANGMTGCGNGIPFRTTSAPQDNRGCRKIHFKKHRRQQAG